MSDLVADSCIAAKWIIAEADSPQALQAFQDTINAGGKLILLDLALVEVTNVIWKRFHRGLATAAEVETMFSDLLGLPCSIEPAAPRLKRALEIARIYHRSVYDALYVALSEELGLFGVTSDEPLFQAVHADFSNIRLLRDWIAGQGFIP
jgi:predicted nucleic acid-binding protein